MQGFISQELTWVESHLLCVIWSVVKGEGCRQLLLTSLLLANNRYLRGRLPEGALEIALANKSKGSKSHESSASGRTKQVCQQERPWGMSRSSSVSRAPWEKPLASRSIRSPAVYYLAWKHRFSLGLCLWNTFPALGQPDKCVHHTSVWWREGTIPVHNFTSGFG